MKISIERVENGYIVEYMNYNLDEPVAERVVFAETGENYNNRGFDAKCLQEALGWVAAEFSIHGGSSDFDKEVVRVILERGDELDPEEE